LEQGVRTGDFGDKNTSPLNTTQFAEVIIGNFGKAPQLNAKELLPNKPALQTVFKLEKNPMMVSHEMEQEIIAG
jgi:isocitrate dehydrogenase